MSNVDQFESIFKSADKAAFAYHRYRFKRVLVVTDLPESMAVPFVDRIRSFLSVLESDNILWQHLGGEKYSSVGELLKAVESASPDLIITYRHLKSDAWQWPHGLGEYVDVLIQASSKPVMMMPHPDANRALPHSVKNTDRVMAITNHLTGDDRLVNYAVRLTTASGVCWLSHVEPHDVFDRYMDVISKIPEIQTDTAREMIHDRLMKEPLDYIESCRRILKKKGVATQLNSEVLMGEQIEIYERLIDHHKIDLLVMESTDSQHLAMNAATYPMAVNLRQVPLLLI